MVRLADAIGHKGIKKNPISVRTINFYAESDVGDADRGQQPPESEIRAEGC